MQHLSDNKIVVLISAVLICAPVSSRAATQSLDDLAGYWVSVGNYGNATLTRYFEVTTHDGKLVIHSTALKFELPNRPPELSDPAPDETFELAAQGSELVGIHRTASFRTGGCYVEPGEAPASGRIGDDGQISLEINTGHIVRGAEPMACHLDYGDPVMVTVRLSRRIDN
jgi:hypothetical protein